MITAALPPRPVRGTRGAFRGTGASSGASLFKVKLQVDLERCTETLHVVMTLQITLLTISDAEGGTGVNDVIEASTGCAFVTFSLSISMC